MTPNLLLVAALLVAGAGPSAAQSHKVARADAMAARGLVPEQQLTEAQRRSAAREERRRSREARLKRGIGQWYDRPGLNTNASSMGFTPPTPTPHR